MLHTILICKTFYMYVKHVCMHTNLIVYICYINIHFCGFNTRRVLELEVSHSHAWERVESSGYIGAVLGQMLTQK